MDHRHHNTSEEVRQCPLCAKLDDEIVGEYVASKLQLIRHGQRLYVRCPHGLIDARDAIDTQIKHLFHERDEMVHYRHGWVGAVYAYLRNRLENCASNE